MNNLNNKIVIINDAEKENLLNNIDSLINIKIITLSELKKKYYFDYTNQTLIYICNKYNVVLDTAKKYINSIYYINDSCDTNKVKFLNKLKQDLMDNNLLIENKLFKEFLKDKDIVLYNLENIDKFYLNIFDELKQFNRVEELNNEKEESITNLYEANSKDEEVAFVASSICKLIKSGVDINNIKLANVNDDYIYSIKTIFKMFNIPAVLPSNNTIKGTKVVRKFKELFSNDIEKTINDLKEYVDDEEVYKQIINILNNYTWADNYEDIKEYIFNDIDNIKKKQKQYKNAVRVIDFENESFNDEYVFLINYNEGVIPHDYKDEDYLSDKEKLFLGVSPSYELNTLSRINIQNKIKYTKNLTVTYSNHSLNGELYISNSYDEKLFNKGLVEIDYTNSDDYNKARLVSLKDNNNKYGVVDYDLVLLNTHYKDEKYLNYDNKFKGINDKELYDYLGNGLTLSYSTMNSYYQCKFRYYLSQILHLNKYESTFETTVGNIFHHILAECFVEEYDFDSAWDREIKIARYEFSEGDKFFLSILKDELVLIIKTIKEQLESTELLKSLYEQEILIEVNKELNIKFKGFVDKILYDDFDGVTIAAIIDYKTGNPDLNINNAVYGLDMQLPVYIYLLKNSNIVSNVEIGGFYLQKILSGDLDIEDRIDSLKLQGYSNSDIDILEKVDKSYKDSKVIKNMKITGNGFYQHAKVINSNQIDALSAIVGKKIDEASKDIIKASFDINPKKIKDDLVGCKYCDYRDICFMKNEDIVELEKPEDLLGGVENDNMD